MSVATVALLRCAEKLEEEQTRFFLVIIPFSPFYYHFLALFELDGMQWFDHYQMPQTFLLPIQFRGARYILYCLKTKPIILRKSQQGMKDF